MNVAIRIAAVLLGGFTACCGCLRAQAGPAGHDRDERFLLDSANRERAARHLSSLQWDENLARAAHDHALLMARVRTISHQFPGESDLSSRFLRAGVRFSVAAENIGAASSAPEVHVAWMKSPAHRSNLLDPKINTVGIAVVASGDLIYAVEDFAHTAAMMSLEEQEQRVGAQLAARGLRLMETTSGVRETCALVRGVAPGLHPKFLFRYMTTDIAVLPVQLVDELATHAGQYHAAAVGACAASEQDGFDGYRLAVLLY
jgi:hypothetical protein